MDMVTSFQNDNGRTYTVLATLEFNNSDKQEYANSWQNVRAMLLQNDRNHEYVVAQYVGEHSWGFGSYFEELSDATETYTEVVKRYNRVQGFIP